MTNLILPLEGIVDNQKTLPDAYYHHPSRFIEPDDKHVISRKKNGETLSCYGDESWDFNPYKSSPAQYAILNFNKNIKIKSQRKEAKRLMFILLIYGEGKKSSSYSIETLRAFFSKVIVPLSKYSIANGVTIADILSNSDFIFKYINEHCNKYDKTTLFSSFLTLMDRLNNGITGIRFHRNQEIFYYLLQLSSKQKKANNQTALIPLRILSESIRQRWEQIDEISKNIKNLIRYLQLHLESELYGETKYLHIKRATGDNNNGVVFEDAAKKHKLTKLFKKYNVTQRQDISAFFRQIQGTCKHLIHAYTGMRDGEVQNLQMDCMDDSNSKFFRLISYTSKLEGRKVQESWATDKKIKIPILVLHKINKVIGKHYGYAINEMPLFVKTSLFFANKVKSDFKDINSIRFGIAHQLPLDFDSMRITKEDSQELYDADYMRDWECEEQFKVGAQWQFKFHQYRRSLAVYSIQSGLVSLGALQKQFKHTFRDMSLYYGSGATFGKNHISKEINQVRAELEAMSYIKNVIFSDEKLFGSHGSLIEKGIKNSSINKKNYLLENRERTIQRFKDGLMSYKDTALGGCISTEACDASLTRSFLPCIGCDSSILKKSKVENVIVEQEKFLLNLDKTSVMYRTEKEDLEELKKQNEKLKG